jgi:hypothetical protein
MVRDVHCSGDALSGSKLNGVSLPVPETQGKWSITFALGDCEDSRGVKTTAEQDYCRSIGHGGGLPFCGVTKKLSAPRNLKHCSFSAEFTLL